MSSNVAKMKQRILDNEAEIRYLEGLLNSFWTGDVPDNASLDHLILAKYGRIRLTEKAKQPALLAKPSGG